MAGNLGGRGWAGVGRSFECQFGAMLCPHNSPHKWWCCVAFWWILHTQRSMQLGEGQPGKTQPGEGQTGEGQPGKTQPGEGQTGEGQPGKTQPGEGQLGKGKGAGRSVLVRVMLCCVFVRFQHVRVVNSVAGSLQGLEDGQEVMSWLACGSCRVGGRGGGFRGNGEICGLIGRWGGVYGLGGLRGAGGVDNMLHVTFLYSGVWVVGWMDGCIHWQWNQGRKWAEHGQSFLWNRSIPEQSLRSCGGKGAGSPNPKP
eukprot:362942-Chlamydomonas_euryale.AAC.16